MVAHAAFQKAEMIDIIGVTKEIFFLSEGYSSSFCYETFVYLMI